MIRSHETSFDTRFNASSNVYDVISNIDSIYIYNQLSVLYLLINIQGIV